jgi:hypothetical protein
MIEIRVRFWTDQLVEGKGKIRPKHAWAAGIVNVDRNEPHGLVPGEDVPFESLLDLPAKIERLLIHHGVKLHLSARERKYISAE